MPIYYFDSSSTVKKYVSETGTAWVLSLFKLPTDNAIYVPKLQVSK